MPTVASVSSSGNPYIDGLFSGVKWGVTNLTYSFPTSASYYEYSDEPGNNFKAFTAVQQDAVRDVLANYSAVSNLTFTEITETSTQHATIRYAESDSPSTAWAYYPSAVQAQGGDAWFNNSTHWFDNPLVGSYGYQSMLHETGHALGLKHSQEPGGSFAAMPADKDSLEYTVMSYHSYIGSGTSGYSNAGDSYPQTLMMYDIAAIQEMYGANFSTNGGDSVYKWNPVTGEMSINGVGQGAPVGNKIFMTVWDGGGHDTYDFSNYTTDLSVNLQPGAWTTASSAQLANLGGGHYAAGNIANALLYHGNTASLIEDAIGGSGNDTIFGNVANNHLTGGAGNDTITGGGGNDIVDGGAGTDTVIFSGSSANYLVTYNSANQTFTVVDQRAGSPDGTETITGVENFQFSDGTLASSTFIPAGSIAAPSIAGFSPDSNVVGDGITNANQITLTGTAAAGSTVQVFDGATQIGTATTNGSGAWTFTTATLVDGGHAFTATATDGAGNVSTASSALNVTVDTVAPGAPTVASFSTDSGTVGDGITNDNTLLLSGTAAAGSTVQVFDGVTQIGTATANGSGAWSFATATLTDGSHAFTAKAMDAAGNVGAASSALNVTVDTVAPGVPTVASFSPDSNVVGDGVTNANQITLTGTVAAGSTVQLFDGATQIGTATANGSGAWTFATAALIDGSHAFTAKAVDTAGNVSTASSALNVTVDTVAPGAPTVASFSTDSGVVGDGITNDNTLTLSGTAAAGSTVQLFDGVTQIGTATADGSGAWSFATATLVDGSHAFTAKAVDTAGNVSTASSALNVTVDTVAPGAPTVASFSTDSGVVGDGITNDNTLTLSGTAAAGSTVQLFDGATQIGTATANGSGAWTFATATLIDGSHAFTAKAMDAAGNVSAASTALNVTVDTVAPGAPTVASFSTDSGVVGDGITNDNTLTLSGTAAAGSTVQLFDGATQIGTATANGSGAWTFATATLIDGSHAFTAKAMDAAGNVSAASTALNVTVDTVAPGVPTVASFSPDSNVVGDGVTNANQITLSGTAVAGSTVQVFDGVTQIGTATANGSGAWTFTTATLIDGSHAFTAKAVDTAGNISSASTALNVTVDTVAPGAPTIASFSTDSGVVGDGITNDNTLALTGTAVAGSTVQVFDGVTQIGTATADGSGAWSFATATLIDGSHAFTAKAMDAAGNVSAASSALNVTIDTVAPGVPTVASFSPDSNVVGDGVTNANQITLSGTAVAGSTVQVFDGATQIGTATANGSGAWTFTTATLTDGSHAFTAKAVDTAANISSASTALNVTIDTVAPGAPTIASFSTDSGTVGDGITNDNTLALTGTAVAGSTVQVFDGVTQIGTATANGSGAWTFATATLIDGSHAFTAKAVDAAGNVSTASSALNVTIDTVAPGAPTVASFSPDSNVIGDGITSANQITLSGTAAAGSTVQVFDGATQIGTATANGSGAWTFATATLTDGSHAFTAKAVDTAGNVSAASTALNVTVDTAAPGAPTIASFSTDSGVVGDGITNDNTLALTGTAVAGSTVQVFDGATQIGTATADGSGAWTFATAALIDGSHAFTAKAMDAAGNISAASSALNVTVDTVAPGAPTIASFSTDSGVLGDGITNDNTLTLSGSAVAGSTVQLFDGATQIGTATANGSGAWTFATATLVDGSHAFTAKAVDTAGNVSAASTALNVTVDTVAPGAPTIASFSTDSGVVGDGITNDNTLALTGTAVAGSTVQVFDGATQIGTATANGSGAWTFATATLVDGSHAFTAKAVDTAGNVSAASTALNVTVDTAAPGAPTIASFSTDSGVVGDGITNDNTLALTGTAVAGSTVQVFDGATQIGTATANGSGAWTIATATLVDGSHAFTAKAVDTAGNVSAASTALNVTVDTAAPGAPTIASFSTDSGVVGDGITNDNTLALTGTAVAGSTVQVFDGATQIGTATADGSGAWSFATATLIDGSHAFTAKAMDVAGNVSAASTALNVTVDTAAPGAPTIASFSTDSGVLGDGITNDNTLTLSGSAVAGSTVQLFDGATQIGTATANGSGAWTFATATLVDGSHDFTAKAMDAAGNVSAASTKLTVTIDTVAPVAPILTSVSADSSQTLTGTAESGSTVFVFDGATQIGSATANGSGAWSFSIPALTSGSHVITGKAMDLAGNLSAPSATSDQFTIFSWTSVDGGPGLSSPTLASTQPTAQVLGSGRPTNPFAALDNFKFVFDAVNSIVEHARTVAETNSGNFLDSLFRGAATPGLGAWGIEGHSSLGGLNLVGDSHIPDWSQLTHSTPQSWDFHFDRFLLH